LKSIKKIKNNQEHEKLRKNGRTLIKQKFSWKAITKKIIAIYKKVLNEKKQ